MTINEESLRPAFEAWHTKEFGMPPGISTSDGWYIDPDADLMWKTWCAAFESLGEPVGYASNDRLNAIISAAQFDNALPKNRTEYTIPLYRLPEVN